MTKDEILQERKWLMTKSNKSNPMYGFRLLEYNRQVDLYNKELSRKAKVAIKSLKVGDVVYLPERYNRKGLWRVDKLLQKNVLLTPVGESDIKGRLKCSAELLIKVEAEDETLVNSLDDIGLI
jgi:hypothetical protein